MPQYRVEINGQNFLIEIEGRLRKHGFFTWRHVAAGDATSAKDAAIQSVRETQRLRELVRNISDDPPVMDVTSIEVIRSIDDSEGHVPGFIWYDENPKRWWQFWRR